MANPAVASKTGIEETTELYAAGGYTEIHFIRQEKRVRNIEGEDKRQGGAFGGDVPTASVYLQVSSSDGGGVMR